MIYIRRSHKRAGSERVVGSAETSDETQIARCAELIPAGARYEVISDSGGRRTGRNDRRGGWQEVIRRVAGGGIAGIAAYDIARLARNARLVLNLNHALEETGADLRIAEVPDARWKTAEGRFLLGILAHAAQFQGDYDAKRMTDMARSTFEHGGHLGNDPFGYRTVRNELGQVAKPRTLEIVEPEAEIVRRVFSLVATKSCADVARQLQREGVKRRTDAAWTKDAVKDIVRRGRVYLGYVVYRRGAEELAGRHGAIIDERLWSAARRGIAARQSGSARRSSRARVYLLSGLAVCECGRRLHGQTRSARGGEWRYYLCRHCGRKAISADAAEGTVLAALRTMTLPDARVEVVRDELRRRLALPRRSEADALRSRLEQRVANLKSQFEWGDIDEAS